MANDIFLKIGDIRGESQADEHKGEIDILSWAFGMSNTTNLKGPGVHGRASVRDLRLTKYIDAASADLWLGCCLGTVFDKAKLTLRTAGGKPLDTVVIEFEQIAVSMVDTSGGGGETRMTETITLNFAKFKMDYSKVVGDKGEKAGNMSYDIPQNK